LTIDLQACLRRTKPEKRWRALKPRSSAELVAVADVFLHGRPAVVPDTNVYILYAAGRLPPAVRSIVKFGLLSHCSVCASELATGVANADPKHPKWSELRDYYETLIMDWPSTRLLNPTPTIWTEAGLIAGTLARMQGFQRNERKECLNDALIFLTAAAAGLPVLTSNRSEFDLIQQLAPHGQFIHF
jgi:predicted nucleic acid-binding protein